MTSLKPLNLRCKFQQQRGGRGRGTIHSFPIRFSKLANNNNNITMLCTKNSLIITDHHHHHISNTAASSHSEFHDLSSSSSIITRHTQDDRDEDHRQKLDQWVKDSAVEIVKNLDEAPFLCHIYCCNDHHGDDSNGNTTRMIKMVKEKGVVAADGWPTIEGRWKRGETPAPNGVILVEQLVKTKTTTETSSNSQSACSATKLWGILIQAKAKTKTNASASVSACYLLKTSQVQCVAGGLCTHFCLSRVDCFVEHPDVQLQKLWLAAAPHG